MIQRHSSRRNRLDRTVLNQRLVGAVSYDRIAGYFRSSLFEVAGEAINNVQGTVRVICNSNLDPQDLVTAAAAQAALRQSWCAGQPEAAPPAALPRYQALFEALTSGKMVVRGLPEALQQLLSRSYTCVIVDESHRARRRKVPKVDATPDEVDERAEPNKLMAFLKEIGPRTKSMLLVTATPVQLHPVEAWDLLDILSQGNEGVLGGWTHSSPWFRASHCLDIANGETSVPPEPVAGWEYVRDPLPSRAEDPAFDSIRRNLDADDKTWQFKPEVLSQLSPAIRRVQLQNNVLPSVEDRVHQLFGQIPDTLEDVWVKIALEGEQEALQLIDRTTATRNPFDAKYSKVDNADWETCSLVLEPRAVKEQLSKGW